MTKSDRKKSSRCKEEKPLSEFRKNKSRSDFPQAEDLEVRQAMDDVREIMESGHEVIRPALMANLAAFKYAIQAEQENERQKRDNEQLRQGIKDLKAEVERLERWSEMKKPTLSLC